MLEPGISTPPASVRERGDSSSSSSAAPTSLQQDGPTSKRPTFPYLFDKAPASYHAYIDIDIGKSVEGSISTFFVAEAMAEYDESKKFFTVKKAPVDAEICVDKLPDEAHVSLKG